jgi:hypothetical protein
MNKKLKKGSRNKQRLASIIQHADGSRNGQINDRMTCFSELEDKQAAHYKTSAVGPNLTHV